MIVKPVKRTGQQASWSIEWLSRFEMRRILRLILPSLRFETGTGSTYLLVVIKCYWKRLAEWFSGDYSGAFGFCRRAKCYETGPAETK